jgi:hypothetical protein
MLNAAEIVSQRLEAEMDRTASFIGFSRQLQLIKQFAGRPVLIPADAVRRDAGPDVPMPGILRFPPIKQDRETLSFACRFPVKLRHKIIDGPVLQPLF